MQEEFDNNPQQSSEGAEESYEQSDGAFVDGQKPKSNVGALATLGAVVILGAGAFLYMKKGPQQAAADTVDQSASATINEFLHGNGGNMMEQTLKDTEKVVQEFKTHAQKPQVPLSELLTNPFRLKEAKPQTSSVAEVVPSRIREDEERQRISTEANALELQSVLRGGRSACLLNNALYHEGEQIGNFTIDEIRPKSIVVHQGKYRFELTMKK